MKKLLLSTVILLGLSQPALAKDWIIDYDNSKLGFAGLQGTNKFEGSFKRFEAKIDFDQAHPENGKISATIDVTSAKTGDAERDSAMPQKDWFNTDAFPKAEFTSSSIRATGADCYEATGDLSIKGVSKKIALPFCLEKEEAHWRAKGKVTIARNDFQVGLGQWADEKMVKYAVEVTVDLSAKPAP